MDQQVFIERILENESLTGDLEDAPASQLLQWGAGQVPALVQEMADEEAAGAKVNALMALMRQVNRTAGSSLGAEASDLADAVQRLLERLTQVYGAARETSAAEVEEAATVLAALSPDQAVTFLLEWLRVRQPFRGQCRLQQVAGRAGDAQGR